MKHTYAVSGMTCGGCAASVEKALNKLEGVTSAVVNLNQSEVEVSMQHHIPTAELQQALAAYPSYVLSDKGDGMTVKKKVPSFWNDGKIWKRASLNTLNCLIGCSIGDFLMILYLQAYHPGVGMTAQMILAIVAGLITSVLFETILLHFREKFVWKLALQTAVSMSFISMVAMELVMNTTDFMITGGKASFGNPMYWTALVVAMVAGFLAPLPYNYYKLKKYNKACH